MKPYAEQFWIHSESPETAQGERLRIHAYFDSRWEPGFVSRNNGGQYAVCSLILSGKYSVETNGVRTLVRPGTFRISTERTPYDRAAVTGSKPLIRKCLLVEMNVLHESILNAMFPGGIFKEFVLVDISRVESIMDSFKAEFTRVEGPDDIRLGGLYMMLLHELSLQTMRRTLPEALCEALDYMNRNLTDSSLSVPDAAAHAGAGTRTLTRLFRKYLGLAPAEYLREMRLKRVAAMLTSSFFSVKEIAALSGFSNASFMARSFRKKFGKTPKDFRNKR